jgi:hypothetical protein
MNNANKCPKCKQYIIGTYCYTCKDEISNLLVYNFDGTPFEDLLNPFMGKKNSEIQKFKED